MNEHTSRTSPGALNPRDIPVHLTGYSDIPVYSRISSLIVNPGGPPAADASQRGRLQPGQRFLSASGPAISGIGSGGFICIFRCFRVKTILDYLQRRAKAEAEWRGSPPRGTSRGRSTSHPRMHDGLFLRYFCPSRHARRHRMPLGVCLSRQKQPRSRDHSLQDGGWGYERKHPAP